MIGHSHDLTALFQPDRPIVFDVILGGHPFISLVRSNSALNGVMDARNDPEFNPKKT